MMPHKRLLSFFLSLCFVASLSLFAYAAESTAYIPFETDPAVLQLNTGENMSIFGSTSINLEENLTVSANAYDTMMRSFFNSQPTSNKNKQGEYTVSGITSDGFPKSYAGAYINQNLDLVVLLTEDTTITAHTISESQNTIISAANTDDIIFSTAQYSYCTLVSLMNDIYQYIESGKNGTMGFNIVSYLLDDYNNQVVVGLENISPSSISSFKSEVADSPAITFTTVNPQAVGDDSALRPGQGINVGSAGFRVYKYENNEYIEGFVTAAHCYNPGDPVKLNGTTVAYAHNTAWQLQGNMDAVFCRMRISFHCSNTISYIGGNLTPVVDANLSQGHPVTMVGASTRGSSGTIQSISYGCTIDGISHFDLAASDYARENGDSGGIVISTRTGINSIAGIHKGWHGPYSIFSKAINITSGLNLTFNDGSNM